MTEKKKNEYKMWFHCFMIYFALWAFAAFAAAFGVRGISDTLQNGMRHKVLFVIAWVLLIADGAYLVKVRFDMAGFRENVPRELLIAGLAGAGILLLIQGLIYSSGEDVYARDVETALIIAIWTIGVYRYVNMHQNLFVK